MSSQIVVPAAARSVISATPKTTFKVGSYSALSDTFTSVLDLNDHVNYWLVSADLAQPAKVYSRSTTIRAAGERIANWNYQNRHITLTIQLLYEAGTSALLAAVRTLLAAIENPPYRLAFAAPNSTVLTYADVVAVTHTIPYDGKQILAQTLTKITIDFECAPGFAGDRITLSNLVVNPGFEAPNGPAVNVFDDPLTTTNAYTTGGTLSASGGTMNVANGTLATFGSSAWGAVNRWQIRFFWITGLTAFFFPHFQDGNNKLFVQVSGTSVQLWQVSGGTSTQIGSATVALTNTNYYWVVFTQFPAAPGTQAYLSAQLINDNLGNPTGSVVATITGPSVSGVTGGLSGPAAIEAVGAQLSIGGPYTHTNQYTLFGPGVWIWGSSGTGMVAGAWEQNTANAYSGGAATSYGAGRLDLPPAGTVSASWSTYTGGTPGSALGAIPVSVGQMLAASAWAKTTSGLSATGVVSLVVSEWDASGAFLRSTTLASVTGAHTSWTQLSGTVTAGASTAYASVGLMVADATAGASANTTIWFDNVQCWNQTTTGQTTMPYCELRFQQSPAQLLVTGLQGDMVAPAYVAFGTFLSSWGLGASLTYALGRRSQASANAQLVGITHGYYGTLAPPQATAVLDSSSYGGFYPTVTLGNGWNPRAFSFAPADALGVYHLFSRFWTNQSAGNLGNVATRVVTQQRTQAWWGDVAGQTDQRGAYYGPFVNPVSVSSTWAPCDSGQANVPPLPMGALVDLSQNYLTPRAQWADSTAGGSTARINWQMMLPVDGAVLVGQLLNPSNAPFSVTNEWLFAYLDGLLLNQLGLLNGELTDEGATYSLETAPLPNPAHSAGGPGTSSVGVISINNAADAYLTLDPNVTAAAASGVTTAAGGVGVNQLAGYLADNAGAVLPLYVEIAYTPLYLYPRGQ